MKKTFLYLFFYLTSFCWAADQKPLNQEFDTLFEHLKKYREQDRESQMLACGKKALLIAEALDDYSKKAKVYIALGNYYSDKNESSITAYDYYYKAYRSYSHTKDAVKMAKTLLRLAILEKNTKNYLKSKESCFLALELLGDTPNEFLESIYNNLGIVYGELQDVKTALMYHKKALTLRIQDNQQELILQSYNNIATAYMDNGDLNNAVSYFKKGLSYPATILHQFPEENARLLDNYTHLQFLQGKKEVLPNLLKALSIREKCEHQAGIIISYLHLATYYQDLNQLHLSNTYAQKAYQKASQTKNYRDVLTALTILEANSRYLKNYKKALEYANKHKQIVDYLAKEELKINEKFADIRYLASQKQKVNEKLQLQNKKERQKAAQLKKYSKMLLIALLLVVILGVFYLKYTQLKAKEKEVLKLQKEQEAENQITHLLLEQQVFAEKAKQKEQQRIAYDLHDSVAGKLSGMKLQMDNLSIKATTLLQPKLDSLVNQMEDVVQEIQAIVYDLNNQKIAEISFAKVLKELILQQSAAQCNVEIVGLDLDWNSISNSIKIVCYYVVQQALRNVEQHAEATHVKVIFDLKDKQLIMQIIDNGKGFDTKSNSNIGIPSMQKRVESVSGTFQIDSKQTLGTSIIINFPL